MVHSKNIQYITIMFKDGVAVHGKLGDFAVGVVPPPERQHGRPGSVLSSRFLEFCALTGL